MSWVQAAVAKQQQNDRDEVFDEEGDEMSLLQKDWRKSMEHRLKEGYRDGVDAGKETSLQKGFNLGYKLGVNTLMPFGELRGTISALLTWCHHYNPEPSGIAQLNMLLTVVRQCEENLVKSLSSNFQTLHPSQLSTAMEDMGLLSDEIGNKVNEQGSCTSDKDCCKLQDQDVSSLANCTTTQELRDVANHECSRIMKETLSVAETLGVSPNLLFHLQKFKD
ncbi:protein YAE1 homolog [Bombina bombina]|uniref:protein YAE1 homolog n=1 Tax=Bombina bombina TaxID=8345 RepID=UPI00235B0EB9|nr:protein YAE1 homolog [Bombina bombina]